MGKHTLSTEGPVYSSEEREVLRGLQSPGISIKGKAPNVETAGLRKAGLLG